MNNKNWKQCGRTENTTMLDLGSHYGKTTDRNSPDGTIKASLNTSNMIVALGYFPNLEAAQSFCESIINEIGVKVTKEAAYDLIKSGKYLSPKIW
jgi:hypothetical protein